MKSIFKLGFERRKNERGENNYYHVFQWTPEAIEAVVAEINRLKSTGVYQSLCVQLASLTGEVFVTTTNDGAVHQYIIAEYGDSFTDESIRKSLSGRKSELWAR